MAIPAKITELTAPPIHFANIKINRLLAKAPIKHNMGKAYALDDKALIPNAAPAEVPDSKINVAASKDAPLLIPMIPGSAKGFRKSTCKQAEAPAMEVPTIIAVTNTGSFNCINIWDSKGVNEKAGGIK